MKHNYGIPLLIVCSLFICSVASGDSAGQILIDPTQSAGEILPLLGVNAGPAPVGDQGNPDITTQYHDIGVQSIRNHDIYGAHSMSLMYPDRMCDPTDPSCYNFSASDTAFAAMVNGNFTPYFRIGDGYEIVHPPTPSEQEHWSDAAVMVIRHYREGLWNGFSSDIRCVEIWNEPDNVHFWPKPHTQEEFFALYAKTAKKIKAAFPDLKVGGPGVTPAGIKTERGRAYLRSFLTYVKENQVPLDFLSWHMYSNNPEDYSEGGIVIDSLLREYGFENAENHLTEYHTDVKKGTADKNAFDLRTGSPGSAILTAAWISLQNSGVDEAYVYRGNDPTLSFPVFYGIFYADGRPKKPALAFSLWSAMVRYHKKIPLEISGFQDPVYALAGQDDAGNIGVLISNPGLDPRSVSLSVQNRVYPEGEGLMVSDRSDEIQKIRVTNGQVTMPPDSLVFIPCNLTYSQ